MGFGCLLSMKDLPGKPSEEVVGTWKNASLACCPEGCLCFLGLASESARGRWGRRDIPVESPFTDEEVRPAIKKGSPGSLKH